VNIFFENSNFLGGVALLKKYKEFSNFFLFRISLYTRQNHFRPRQTKNIIEVLTFFFAHWIFFRISFYTRQKPAKAPANLIYIIYCHTFASLSFRQF